MKSVPLYKAQISLIVPVSRLKKRISNSFNMEPANFLYYQSDFVSPYFQLLMWAVNQAPNDSCFLVKPQSF